MPQIILYMMCYIKNMLNKYLISSGPFYSAVSDYTTHASFYVRIKNHLLNIIVILNKTFFIAIDITKWKKERNSIVVR